MRGVSADIIILEEAAFIDPKVFKTVVVPLMGVNKTAVIAISTPDDELNYYSSLMELKDEFGNSFFKTIRVGLSCDVCMAAGIVCMHKLRRLPPWKSAARQRRIQKILEQDEILMKRETQGIIISTNCTYCFEAPIVNEFVAREPYQFKFPLPVIYTAIDPGGGGVTSDYAIMSMGIENGNYGLLSLDASNSHKDNDIMAMLTNHILNLRKIHKHREAWIVIFIEANDGWLHADRLKNLFMGDIGKFGKIYLPAVDNKNLDRVGVRTTQWNKPQYVRETKALLSEGKLHFSSEFVGQNEVIDKKNFMAQLRHYRKELTYSKNPADPPKVRYTGKSAGTRDDLAMVLQILIYWARMKKFDDPQFQHWAACQGIRL